MPRIEHKLILVIDDSIDNQGLLTLLFEAQGYAVQCASNGEEALGLLRELTILPDLILLDAHMPVMDGFQFRIAQRKIVRLSSIPVILMTGDTEVDLGQMDFPAGILFKPLRVKSLVETLRHQLWDLRN